MKILPPLFLGLALSAGQIAHGQDAPVTTVKSTTMTPSLAPSATTTFYIQNSQKQVWGNDETFDQLLAALKSLEAHGLAPSDYHLVKLEALNRDVQAREKLATDAWFSAASNMLQGKLNPLSVEPDWTAKRRQADLQAALTKALADNNIRNSFEQFQPRQAGYAALKAEYARLLTEAAKPQTLVTAGPALKSGTESPRVILLKARLSELGYLPAAEFSSTLDDETVAAVKAFQFASDLDDDGAAGPATLAALNRGLSEKINQVRVNMERWRWLPDDLGQRHLRANIAGFNVTAWKDGIQERSHLTIVGKPFRKTPVFSDEVEYLVLNPWWETPNSLATRDKLPAFKKDPAAVQRLGFQVLDRSGTAVNASTIDWNSLSAANFPYRIRQAPGELNALGQVKIMFPNKHNVYLHDTPTRGLFSQRQRAFSSGCMRTENPLALSAWLLEDTRDWSLDRINAVVATGKETRVNLTKPVQVHVLYFTVVNEGQNGVRYLDDIYARDMRVLDGLRAKPKTL